DRAGLTGVSGIPSVEATGDEPESRLPLSEFEAAVFRALQEDGRVAFTAVAQRLGVSEANVRRTVKQLVAREVFTITAVADPRLMGLESMAWLALSVQLSQLERTARALPGVQRTETYPYFQVLRQQFRWTNEEEPPAVADETRGVRSAPAELDELDRVLIGELQDDGRASFRDIGQRLGVSERAVSTRFTRLVEEDLVRVIAVGNPHALGFHGLAWVGVSLSDLADVDEVAEAFGRIPQVSYLVSVSGRFDLMGEL